MRREQGQMLGEIRRLRTAVLAVLALACYLVGASVAHPILHHDHECEHEECLLADCLATPQAVPALIVVEVPLETVEQAEPVELVLPPSEKRAIPVSRGPPACGRMIALPTA